MKSLSLSKPLIIALVGIPGAGKSFFARQFSDTFGAPLVSYDRLRHELFTQPNHTKEEQDIIARIVDYQLGEILKTKQTCILDGVASTRVDRMKIAKKAREAGYELLVVWVQTDEATAKQRATKGQKGKIVDQYAAILTPEQYVAQAKKFTAPNHSEQYVVISGKHTYAAQVKVVLKRLAKPRERAQATPTPTERDLQTPRPRRQSVIIR